MEVNSPDSGPEIGTLRRGNVFLGPRNVSLFNRFLAQLIDLFVALALFYVGRRLAPAWGHLAGAAFFLVKDSLGGGQSIGKRIVGTRVVEETIGLPGGLRESFLRNFPFALALALMGSPWLWLFFLLLALPWCLFEAGLVIFLPTGVRLGDIVANTSVDEVRDDFAAEFQFDA